jgi:hypothetical protein
LIINNNNNNNNKKYKITKEERKEKNPKFEIDETNSPKLKRKSSKSPSKEEEEECKQLIECNNDNQNDNNNNNENQNKDMHFSCRKLKVESVSALDLSSNDEILEKAATKIQSTFRGYKSRKRLKAKKPSRLNSCHHSSARSSNSESAGEAFKSNRSNSLTAVGAATKIQSTFRGYSTRKILKNKLNAKNELKARKKSTSQNFTSSQQNEPNSNNSNKIIRVFIRFD